MEAFDQVSIEAAAMERESAKRARDIAHVAAGEVAGVIDSDRQLAEEWAKLARQAAGLATGHATMAALHVPGSREALEAAAAAAQAVNHAESAEGAARRD
jgi:hypothetical protein